MESKWIKFKVGEYSIEVELKDRLTIIKGDSGTGKSLLYKLIKERANKKVITIDADKALVGNGDKTAYEIVMGLLKGNSGHLVVIDNADIILNKQLREYIAKDVKNQYIIFGRSTKYYNIGTNNVAYLVRDDINKRIYLEPLVDFNNKRLEDLIAWSKLS